MQSPEFVKPDSIDITKNRDYDKTKIEIGAKLRWLKKNDPAKLVKLINGLSEQEAKSIMYDPMVMCRPKQLVNFESPYIVTLYLAGRG